MYVDIFKLGAALVLGLSAVITQAELSYFVAQSRAYWLLTKLFQKPNYKNNNKYDIKNNNNDK